MNNNSYSNSYKDAGVDVTAGYKAVELMKQYVARTVTKGVLDGIGGFGGLFELAGSRFGNRRRRHKDQDRFPARQA